jgi:hypothetical protein
MYIVNKVSFLKCAVSYSFIWSGVVYKGLSQNSADAKKANMFSLSPDP